MIDIGSKKALFIDAHGHIFDTIDGVRFNGQTITTLKSGRYGTALLGGETIQFLSAAFEKSNSPLEVLLRIMELNGVDKVFIPQTPAYGPQEEYINAAISAHPGKFATTACLRSLDKPVFMEAARRTLGEWRYKALKFEMPDTPFDPTLPEYAFVFETLMDYGAYCMADLGWGHDGPYDFMIDAFKTVVKRYPGLTFVFPHLGISRLWDPAERGNYDSLKKTLGLLDLNENIWFDLSGLPMAVAEFGEEYPYPTITGALKVVKQAVGMDRVMWGSDYPTVTNVCTYRQTIDLVLRHCDFLSETDLENVFGKTADKLWFGC